MLTLGQQIGRYRILSSIGAGGMGEVFLAEDIELERSAALKVLPIDVANDSERIKRFIQEAKAASALNHPNILTIYEVGTFDNTRFIASEYVKGETLRDRLKNEKLEIQETLDIAIQIASALQAAHSAKIVHRDIKPENIMVREDNLVKILDFGLAKLTKPQPSENPDTSAPTKALVKTAEGTVIGTVSYMSPEQARGKEVDERTDIWSFGVVLYEMVCSQMPFTGESANDVIASILKTDPSPVSHYVSNVPKELERIIGKTLRKNREERYQHIKDLWLDLKDLKQEMELEARLGRSAAPNKRNEGITDKDFESKTQILERDKLTESAVAVSTKSLGASNIHSTSSAEYVVNEIKQHKRGVLAVLSILLLSAIAFGYWFFNNRSANTTQIDSIAVLPFENGSGNPDSEYLSDGMTESLINSLSQLPNMKVIARSSVFRYKGKDTDLQTIARELNVRAVITGRVIQRGDTLDVNVNLTDAQNNAQLWGQRYSRKLADVFAVQDEIAKQATNSLRVKLTGETEQRLTKRYTNSEEAYKLYLQGRYQWNKRTGESLKKAVEFYKQAIEKDPNFALAYAALAECYVLFPNFAVAVSKDIMPQAKAAARKALELDDSLAEAHAALGLYQSLHAWNQAAAEKELRRAVELNPNYATAYHWLGNSTLLIMQRFDEAIAAGRRAEELDPLSPIISADTGWNLLFARRYDEAIVQLKQALTLDPNFPYTHWVLGMTYHAKGMYPEAIAEYKKALQLYDEPFAKAWLARSLVRLGHRNEALKLLEELKTQSAKQYVPSIAFVVAYASLGNKDEAFIWLEKDFAERSMNPPFYGTVLLDDLRGDPRFDELIKRANASVLNE